MIELRAVRGSGLPVIGAVKDIAAAHPGAHEIVVRVGATRLRLGPEWRFADSPACLAALAEFGDVAVRAD